jgi:8-oxo-dGTP pyrophosphatase MutT (NUDIX family)
MKPKRFSAGAVVLRREGESWRFLMLRVYRNWDFPKGEVEPAESPLAAARREVEEETSLASLEFPWGEAYCETEPYSGGKVARYYLAEAPHGVVLLPRDEKLGRPEHHEYRWLSFDDARALAPPRLQPILAWANRLIGANEPAADGASDARPTE